MAFLAIFTVSSSMASARTPKKPAPRGQWTEEQAWNWEKKVGEIKGFNQPEPAYPGQTRDQILRKAAEFGLNSVRFWISGSSAEEQIEYIRRFAEDASKYGMTVSPVFNIQLWYYSLPDEEKALRDCEDVLRKVVRAFATDERIILWDIWNEPRFRANEKDTMRQMDWLEKMVLWCRDEGICQPITSSIIWDAGYDADTVSDTWKRRAEIEGMMDVHNFHDYQVAENMGRSLDVTLRKIRRISDRPIVCTECLSRAYGSGVSRTLAAFARERVHFYIWGMYNNDANWSVKWSRSTYDPFDPPFHDMLWADGDMYDPREFFPLKDFRFLSPGEKDPDPGIPVTERWSQERAWKWMVAGPVEGTVIQKMKPSSAPEKYNSVRVPVNYNHWKYDNDAFFKDFDEAVNWAVEKGMTLVPTLVTDDFLDIPDGDLVEYVRSIISCYYSNPTVLAWELYRHPGERAKDRGRVERLVDKLFTIARNQYPNQPVFMTPAVKVKDFTLDFDYKAALVHGRRHGWDMLEYSGVSDADLTFKIWSLSDVTAFSTVQDAPEAGWMTSMCYRFGRPIFCTSFEGKDAERRKAILDIFARSHVYWFSATDVPEEEIKGFRFIPIETLH